MKKLLSRFTSILTAIMLLVSTTPVSALASEKITGGAPSIDLTDDESAKFTVTFDDQGTITEKNVEQGKRLAESDWPEPAHLLDGQYRFDGWYEGETKIASLEDVQGDRTLTAKYVRQYTVTYTNTIDANWTNVNVKVDEGTRFVAANYFHENYPVHYDESFRFTGWEPSEIASISEDAVVDARFRQLKSYTITVNYVFKESGLVAADPYVATVLEGYELTDAIPSPSIKGFICDHPNGVSITGEITEDKDETVYYEPSGDTPYTVRYLQQNLAGGYDEMCAAETRTGHTGSMTKVTEEDAKSHLETGFNLVTDVALVNTTIAADGSTSIEIKYDRQIHYVIFDTANGTYIEPRSGMYGAGFTTPENPTRDGYTFNGWTWTTVDDAGATVTLKQPVSTIQAKDVTVVAKWKVQDSWYTVVVWREDLTGTYTALGTMRFKGKTDTVVSYKADTLKDDEKKDIERYVDGTKRIAETKNYFTYSSSITLEKNGGAWPTIKGDNSTLLNVYYTRDTFTINFYIIEGTGQYVSARIAVLGSDASFTLRDGTVVEGKVVKDVNCEPLHTITAKYEADISAKYPVDAWYSGKYDSVKFNGFQNKGGSNNTEVTSTRCQMDTNLCDISAAHVAKYNPKYTAAKTQDDLYYLLERLDGDYETAGYDQRIMCSNNPGNVTNGTTNKSFKGYKIAGHATYTMSSGEETYPSIYTTNANGESVFKVASRGVSSITQDNIPSLLPGTWEFLRNSNSTSLNGKKIYPCNASFVWFTRIRSTLTFQNGGQSTSIGNLPFGTPLLDYKPTSEPERPVGIDDDYTFDRWYIDAGFSSEVDWDTATMPEGDLVLHAHWIKPEYTVTFDFNDGDQATPAVVQQIEKNGTVDKSAVDKPVRPGYRFDYWYDEDVNGVQSPFTYSVRINRDYTLHAHWTAIAVSYTVNYVYSDDLYIKNDDDTYTKIDKEKSFEGMVGDEKTEYAPALYDAEQHPLFPDTLSSSLTLKAISAENVITFTYAHVETVYYKISYVDENGRLFELDGNGKVRKSSDAYVTVNAVNVKGYTPEYFQITWKLGVDSDPDHIVNNNIIFQYRPNPKGVYEVVYWLQNLNDNGYTKATEQNGVTNPEVHTDVSLGTVAQAEQKVFAGYNYVPAISKASGTVYTSKDSAHLTLYMYYNRSYLPYGAHFVDIDTGESISADVTSTARFGKTMPVVAKSINSYVLVGDANADMLVSADATDDYEANYHTFQYKQSDLRYAVRYLYRDDNGVETQIANPDEFTHADRTHRVKLGESYSQTLSKSTIEFGSETYVHVASDPVTKSVTITENDNYIDFYFAPLTYTIHYDANGGTNAPADKTGIRAFSEVTLTTDAPTPANAEYNFVGWSTKPVEPVYETSAAIGGVTTIARTIEMPKRDATVYAVWSHLTATLSYDGGASFKGTLPASATTTLNAEITVDDGSGISRDGYTFGGWMLKDGEGNLVAPVYGQGAQMTPTIAINVNTTLYAVWKPIDYTIAYHLAATASGLPATAPWSNPNTVTSYNIGSDSITLLDASKDGYAFKGWFIDAACTVAADTTLAKGSYGARDYYAKFAVVVPQLSLTGVNAVYDGEAHAVTLNGASTLLSSDTVTYSVGGRNVANAFADATQGTTVTVAVIRDGNEIWTDDVSVTIAKRPITVTATSATELVYTGERQETATPKYAYTAYDATLNAGLLTNLGHTLSAIVIDDARTDAGWNPVTVGNVTILSGNDDVTANYDVRRAEGTIAVAKAGSSADVEDAEHVYDDTAVGFNTPTLYAGTGRKRVEIPASEVTLRWKYTDQTDWHTEAMPTYTEVRSITKNKPDAYALDIELSHTNYETQVVRALLTIKPAEVTLTADSKEDFPYTVDADGNEVMWTIEGASWQIENLPINTLYANDTINYVLKNNARSKKGTEKVTFESYAIANADHAKNYAIETVAGRLKVVNNKNDASLTAHDQVFDYNASAHTLTSPVVTVKKQGDMTSAFALTYAVTDDKGVTTTTGTLPTFTDAGVYTVVIGAHLDGYTDPAQATITVTVNQALLTLTSGKGSIVYDALEHSVKVLDAAAGLKSADHQVTSASIKQGQVNAATNADNYPVEIDASTVVVMDGTTDVTANYRVQTVPGMLVITQAPLTVTAASAIIAYDGDPHSLTVSVGENQLKGGDRATTSIGEASDKGVHTFTPGVTVMNGTTDVTKNYDVRLVDGTLTIIDFDAQGIDTIFDGQPHTIAVTLPEGYADYDVTYADANGDPIASTFTDAIDATTVTVTLTPKDATSGLPTLTHDVTVKIAAKEISLNVTDIRKTYDGVGAQLNVSLPAGAAVSAADEAAILASVTLTSDNGSTYAADHTFTDRTSEHITASAAAANYRIADATTDVVINARPVSVYYSDSPLTAVYDELAHALTPTVEPENRQANTGLLDASFGHVATATPDANATQTNVTNGQIEAGFASVVIRDASGNDVTGNYAVSTTSGRIEITQAASFELELNSYADVYDGDAHAVSVKSVTDAAKRVIPLDRYDWTFNGVATFTQTDAGYTTVTVVGHSKQPANYPDVRGTASIDIAKRPVTLSAGESLGNVYDGSTVTVGYASNGNEVAGHTIDATLLNNDQSQAGTSYVTFDESATAIYADAAKLVNVTNNYQISYRRGTIEILPAASSVTPTRIDYTYDGTEKSFTAPVLYANGAAVTEPVTLKWRLPGETDWNDQPFPTYTFAASTLNAGGQASDPADYALTPYTIEVELTSANYAAQETTATLTIQRRVLTLGTNDETFVFDGDPKFLTVVRSGLATGDTVNYDFRAGYENRWTAVTVGVSDPTFLRGGHPAIIEDSSIRVANSKGVDVTDCYAVDKPEGVIRITRATSQTAPVSDVVVYNGGAQGYPLPTLLDKDGAPVTENVTYLYRLASTDAWSATPITATNFGTTIIQVRMETTSYEPAETTSTLTINRLPISVEAPSGSYVYTMDANNTPHRWTLDAADAKLASGSNALATGHTFTATLDADTASRSAIGDNAVDLTGVTISDGVSDVTANYDITYVPGRLTVSASTVPALIGATNLEQTYKGSDYTLAQPVISVLSNDNVTRVDRFADFSVQYAVTSDAFEGTHTFTDELPHFTDAGTYTIVISAQSASFPAKPDDVTVTMKINPAALVLKSGTDDSIVYDANEHAVDELLIDSGALQGADAITGYTFVDGFGNTMTDVGSRNVQLATVAITNANGAANRNYAITLNPGHITIAQLNVTGGLTIAGYDDVYDAQAHGVTLGSSLVTSAGTYDLTDARFSVRYTAVSPTEPSSTGATNPLFTDASTHTVTVNVTDTTGNMTIAPITATVVIRPRTVTITADDLRNIPYDGLDHDALTYTPEIAANGKTGLLGTDTASAVLDNSPERIIPGAYTVTVSGGAITSGKPGNYTFAYADGTLEIVKATGVDLTVTPDNAVYDGQAHGFAVTPKLPAGTPYGYRIERNGAFEDVTLAQLPTYVNAGDYPIRLQIYSDYYTDTAEKNATLRIDQRPLTVASENNASAPYTYTGDPQSVTAAFTAPNQVYDLVAGDDYDQQSATFAVGKENVNTNVCDRAVELAGIAIRNVNGDVTANYDLSYVAGRIVINKAASATAATAIARPYNGTTYGYELPVLTAADNTSVALNDVTYEYSADGGATWTADFAKQSNVRRDTNSTVIPYEIMVRMSHANYGTATTTASLTIEPEALTVKADEKSYPFALDANNAPIMRTMDTATVIAGTLYENAYIVPSFTNNTRSAYGSQPVNLSGVQVLTEGGDKTANYTIVREAGSLAITQGVDEVVIDADGDTVTYDALAHGITAPRVLVKNSENVYADMTSAFRVRYDVTYTAPDGATATETDLDSIGYTEAGTYAITVRATAEQYSAPADQTVTLTIEQRVASITSGDNSGAPYVFTNSEQSVDATVNYDGTAQATDLRVSNLVDGHTLANIAYATGASNANTDVTDREVLVSGVSVMNRRTDVTSNYRFNYNAGRIVIVPLTVPAANIVIDDVDEEYDGNTYELTLPTTVRTDAGTLTLTDEFDVEYTYDGSTGTIKPTFIDAGEYPVTVRLISRSGNYAPETVTATVRITARPLTIAYGTVSETYDETARTVSREITGLVDRDAIAVTEQNRTQTDATRTADGTFGALVTTATGYAITAANDPTIDRSGNYAVSVTDGSIEIKPIALTVTADTATHEYNALEQSVTTAVVNGNLVAGHTAGYTLANNASTNVVNAQAVSVSSVTVLNAGNVNVTRNYAITTVDGALTITQAPLTLGITDVTVGFNGLPHAPDGYIVTGVKGDDYLASYTLLNMPQTAAGTYANVAFNEGAVVLRSKATKADVTGNYAITYTTGSLVITQPTTTYTVRYYYDGALGATNTYADRAGRAVTTFEDRPQEGYTYDHAEGLPLTLVRDPASNVISVYYVRVTIRELTTLTDADIPMAGNMASLNVGTAVE